MSVFFLGTCRAYDVARLMNRRRIKVFSPVRRFLSPRQILQYVQHMRGKPYWYGPTTIHLLSPEVFEEIQNGQSVEGAISELNDLRSKWPEARAFVIEITAIKEFMMTALGRPFACAKFVHNRIDDEIVEIIPTESEVLDTLRQIRDLLGGRPVVWMAYAAPAVGVDPHIPANRDKIARLLHRHAHRFGDGFVDPQPIVEEYGQSAFFKDWRGNLDHYTAIGLHHVTNLVQAELDRSARDFAPCETV